jgi:tetratricopeptide (TPR) repeat protein
VIERAIADVNQTERTRDYPMCCRRSAVDRSVTEVEKSRSRAKSPRRAIARLLLIGILAIPAALVSPAAAETRPKPSERDVAECMFPTADINMPDGAIKHVMAACTVLIKSGGGSDEGRAIAYLQRGSMYRRLGKFELALADFTGSLRYDPKSAEAYTGRGNAHRGLGQLDAAIADHSEAIRLNPDFATAYSNRGNVYRDKKDYARAIAEYDQALQLNPRYATALYNRGLAREDSGDRDGAIADYREALRLRPVLKQAAEALKELGAKP